MRSTPDQDERLRERLEQAVDEKAGGSADKLGRMLGYTNGGYIREAVARTKPVRRAIIDRFNGNRDLAGWFDAVLSDVSKTDVSPAPPAPWPLRRWTPDEWSAIDSHDRAVMEDAAMSKLLQLRSERTAHPFSAPEKRQANGK